MTDITQHPLWQSLQQQAAQMPHLSQLQQFWRPPVLAVAGLALDASYQRCDQPAYQALLALAQTCQVQEQLKELFCGHRVNRSENRAALHMALRANGRYAPPWEAAISQEVAREKQRFLAFAQQLAQPQPDAAVQQVLNLGIGGSDLGPRLLSHALAQPQSLPVHYLSNPDPWAVAHSLKRLDPTRTQVVVQSKSFTTPETLHLWAEVQQWQQQAGGVPPAPVAVTAEPERAQAMGFVLERIFKLWDWVGGRYSLSSAMALPAVIAIGRPAFEAWLAGAEAMDEHVLTSSASANLPLHLALWSVWNHNFLGSHSEVVACYAAALEPLVPYLQQLQMESNGKSTTQDGHPVRLSTAPVVWGGLGIDAQHAYFQLLHQGTERLALEFIGIQQPQRQVVNQQLQAQAEALALGRSVEQTQHWLAAQGLDQAQISALAPHRSFKGNVPSLSLWLEQLEPFTLGALVAAYEHKVFYQAAIWGINPFDQWGVELGKTLLARGP